MHKESIIRIAFAKKQITLKEHNVNWFDNIYLKTRALREFIIPWKKVPTKTLHIVIDKLGNKPQLIACCQVQPSGHNTSADQLAWLTYSHTDKHSGLVNKIIPFIKRIAIHTKH